MALAATERLVENQVVSVVLNMDAKQMALL